MGLINEPDAALSVASMCDDSRLASEQLSDVIQMLTDELKCSRAIIVVMAFIR